MTERQAPSRRNRDESTPAPTAASRKRSAVRTWLFRLAAMTLVPAIVLCGFDLLLGLVGYGRPTRFFLKSKVAGRQVYIENINFSATYFPSGVERTPLPILLEAEKAPGAYRIYVLGGSAAQGFPDPSVGFSRILEVMLEDRFPNTEFEVVNTSMTAINSHVVLPIARDCARHEPDLFIVYVGNNEVVGPYGASGVLTTHLPNLSIVRASIWARTTRTGQLLAGLIHGSTPRDDPPAWEGMTMFQDSQIRADDPRLKSVYSQFSRNLRDICKVGAGAGADVIVCTVPSNVKDLPPFASLPSQDMTSEQTSRWNKCFSDGVAREKEHDFDAAIDCYEQARRIDSRRADLNYRIARRLLAAGRPAEARRHFIQARDLDTLRFRADTTINDTIRSAASGRESEGVFLIDAVEAFDKASADKLPGNKLFHEHVHMTFAGNYLLASALFETVVERVGRSIGRAGEPSAPPLSEAECMERLVYTNWKRLTSLTMLEMLFNRPPFTDQPNADERIERIQRQRNQFEEGLQARGFDETIAAYQRMLDLDEDDIAMRIDFAVLLLSVEEFDEAEEQLLELQRRLPHHPVPHVLLAQLYAAQGEIQAALFQCEKALKLQPGWRAALVMLQELHSAPPPAQF